jgi:DNA-binding Lrp family transcriptional regulator
MKDEKTLRKIELRVLCELIKNSKRSDIELARMLRVSQPTVTRFRTKLEKEGYIKEYTLMPDFKKLGYEILAITFVKLKTLSSEKTEEARKIAKQSLREGPFEIVMLERGTGLNYDGAIISYHENYSSYVKLLEWIRQFGFLEVDSIGSYLIRLEDPVRYRPLTLRTLAQHILTLKEGKAQNE